MADTVATSQYALYRDTRFFPALDGLRCFCIFLVLWHHSPAFGMYLDGPRLLTRGFTGVDFFFVLSGYLITTLLLREEDREGRFSLTGFYWRRLLRIVPVYFLVVTLVGAWFIVLRGQTQYLDLWPYYYAFLANFLNGDIPTLAPTWSLSIEEQYYLMWPLTMLLLPAGARAPALLLVVIYAFLATNGWAPIPFFGETEVARFELPIAPYTPILMGTLLAIALHNTRGFAAIYGLVGHRVAPLVLFCLLLLVWQVLPQRLYGWPNFVMHGLMVLLLASLVVRRDHVAMPVLTLRPVARVGAISYGLYLWHLIGLHFANEARLALGWGQGSAALWATTLLYVILGIAIAEVSFRTIERYFLSLKSRRPRPRPVVGK